VPGLLCLRPHGRIFIHLLLILIIIVLIISIVIPLPRNPPFVCDMASGSVARLGPNHYLFRRQQSILNTASVAGGVTTPRRALCRCMHEIGTRSCSKILQIFHARTVVATVALRILSIFRTIITNLPKTPARREVPRYQAGIFHTPPQRSSW